jgi:hypothetical protein
MIDKNISFGGKRFENMINSKKTERIINVISDIDFVINSYNLLEKKDIDGSIFKNLFELKSYTPSLPAISDLEKDASKVSSLRDSTRDTLKLVNKLFETKEWKFNKSVKKYQPLAIAFFLETYGKFILSKNTDLHPVHALEELIAMKRKEVPALYKAIVSWYDEPEFTNEFRTWLAKSEFQLHE